MKTFRSGPYQRRVARAFCDRMNSGRRKASRGWVTFHRDGEGRTVAKNVENRTEALQAQLGLGDGDAVFFVAGVPKNFAYFASLTRQVGDALELVDEQVRVLLVVDCDVRTG